MLKEIILMQIMKENIIICKFQYRIFYFISFLIFFIFVFI